MPLIKMIVVFCCVSLSSISFAAKLVEYKISRMHGLIDFAYALTEEPHRAPGVREIYVRSSEGTLKVKTAIEDIRSLSGVLHSGFDFSSPVMSRQEGATVMDLTVVQSIWARDLEDLSQRVLGLMPLADHKKFFDALKVLEPVYGKLIWSSSSTELEKHKRKLDELAVKVNLDEMFKQAERFYRGQWPEKTPFLIGLYAVPFIKGFQNSTNSHSMGSVEEHGVMVGVKSKELPGSFGVIFHELCHSIYESQSNEFKKEFESYFKSSSSLYKNQAYMWINEALATALGNGWAYEKAGEDPSRKNLGTIKLQLMDTARAFILWLKITCAKCPLDKDFVVKAIEIFFYKHFLIRFIHFLKS